jgi:hypothetical protein
VTTLGHCAYWLLRLGNRLAPKIPRRISYALATIGADLAFTLWRGIRLRTTENFRTAPSPRVKA